MQNRERILHRVVTFLDRRELDFLDRITKDILFSTGVKIPRSTILKELIDIFSKSSVRDLNRTREYRGLVELLAEKAKDEKREEK
jgi:hypothetical protein